MNNRKYLAWSLLAVSFLPMREGTAKEEHFYYKIYGKEMADSARSDRYFVLKGNESIFPENVYLFIYLPRPQDDYYPVKPLTLYFHAATSSHEDHYFSVENLALRDFRQQYDLKLRESSFPPHSETGKRYDVYAEEDGRIYSTDEVRFRRGEYVQRLIDFQADPLPEKVFLEYCFRIRRENGPDMIFQDVLPLELASYKT